MKRSTHEWLHEQLPLWQGEGLLSPDAASALRSRYPISTGGIAMGQIILGALGALLIGSGLIAIIGHNWDDFSRPVRLGIAFFPLLLTQLATFYVLKRGDTAPAWWRETAALLQTFAVGACIAVVSQVYNMGGEWPDFLWWWFILSLPLVALLRAQSVAVFYLITTAVWAVNQSSYAQAWHGSGMLYPVLLAGFGGCWWAAQRSWVFPVGLRWVLALSASFGFAAVAYHATGDFHDHYWRAHEEAWVWFCALIAAAMVLVPLSANGQAESTGHKPQVVLGGLWLLGFGIVGTFTDAADDLHRGAMQAMGMPAAVLPLLVFAAFASQAFIAKRWALLAVAAISLLPMIGGMDRALLAMCYTFYLGALGIVLIVLDAKGLPSAPRLGALLVSAVVIARMMDSDLGLLAKGLAFIVVGIAFLAFNFQLSRQKRLTSV